METPDPLLERVSPVLAAVPGVIALVLGGSRASGAAHSSSDYDLGLYFREGAGLDVGRLLEAAKGLVDDPRAAAVTEVGGWGPWIVGGGWLTIAGKRVDLLYRPIESVEKVIQDCPLRDPHGLVAGRKAMGGNAHEPLGTGRTGGQLRPIPWLETPNAALARISRGQVGRLMIRIESVLDNLQTDAA
jgi:hypothetical protein